MNEPKTLRDLRPAEYNPRSISPEALRGLGNSLETFGDLSGVTWNRRTGNLVCGHQRVQALGRRYGHGLGIEDGAIRTPDGKAFPVRIVDWDLDKEKAANIAANSPVISGEFTPGAVDILDDLAETMPDVFKDLRLAELREMLDFPDDALEQHEDDAPEKPGAPVTRRGDLWHLGGHRLMCGDATHAEDVEQLMGGYEAHMVFTDPPYGVSYDPVNDDFEMIAGDDKRDDELAVGLLAPALKQAARHTAPDAAFYIWHASATREDFTHAMRAAGLVELQYLIWAKPSIVLGYSDYRWSHEPCFYAGKAGTRPAFYGGRDQGTVWRVGFTREREVSTVLGPGMLLLDGAGGTLYLTPKVPKNRKLRRVRLGSGQSVRLEPDHGEKTVWEVAREMRMSHPTQKPVELARRALQNSSRPAEIVLDLFLGSGTTLIGAEATGRRCFGMELDPGYCDVVVRRWEALTGQKAVKE